LPVKFNAREKENHSGGGVAKEGRKNMEKR